MTIEDKIRALLDKNDNFIMSCKTERDGEEKVNILKVIFDPSCPDPDPHVTLLNLLFDLLPNENDNSTI